MARNVQANPVPMEDLSLEARDIRNDDFHLARGGKATIDLIQCRQGIRYMFEAVVHSDEIKLIEARIEHLDCSFPHASGANAFIGCANSYRAEINTIHIPAKLLHIV